MIGGLSLQEQRALKKTEAKYEELTEDVAQLSGDVTAHEWETVDDIEIRRGMKSLEGWRDRLNKVIKQERDLDAMCIDTPLTKDQVDHYKSLINQAKRDVLKTITSVKAQDKERMLFADLPGKPDVVKLPTFQGDGSEDFVKFEEKVKDAFKRNRIVKDDQLLKLRQDCLRGQAKILIPESTKDIDEAWSILKNSFSDPATVMTFRKEKLFKLGSYPPDSSRSGSNRPKQIEWLCSLEVIIKEITEIGDRSMDMAMEAFNQSTIFAIINLFSGRMKTELLRIKGLSGKARLTSIVGKLEEFRAECLDHQFAESLDLKKKSGAPSSDDKPTKPIKSAQQANQKFVPLKGVSFFSKPKRDENCRICKMYDSKGDTRNLYDDHHSNYATGCPRYIELKVEERFEVAKEVKLCLSCHDPKYIWKFKDPVHMKDCIVKKGKKTKFTCRNENCNMHLWVCSRHKDENEAAAQSFLHELKKKGLNFGFYINMMTRPSSFGTEATSPHIADEEPTANNSSEASAENTANNSSEASAENTANKSNEANTMDGQSQFLNGLTIDRLCGNMPVLSLEGATK